MVANLSPACQQLICIAKALKNNVKFLVLDEPTAPLTVEEAGTLFEIIHLLKNRGITILYISHRLEEIFSIADRVTVLRDGKLIETRNVSDIDRAELISKMVGRPMDDNYPTREHELGEEVLRAESLCGNGVSDITFSLRRGEVLGFSGLIGCGRTETMHLIYGAEPVESGKLYIHGSEVKIKSPGEAMANGIALLPEERKSQGLFLEQTIRWNTVFNMIKKICRFSVVNGKEEKSIAETYKEKFNIKAPSVDQSVGELSGGNQQKVVIAKNVATKAEILIFDEPTRGIDVGAKREIYLLINELVAEGHSVIMVSSDMPELIGMCDRIVVMSEKRITGILEKNEFDQDRILDLASIESNHLNKGEE